METLITPGSDWQSHVNAAQAGDTITLLPGNHRGAKLIGRSFSEPLTIRGYPDSVITAGTNTGEGINIEGCENVALESISVNGMFTGARAYIAGIRVVESKRIKIAKCKSSGNKTWGFFSAFVADLEYIDCEADGNVGQHGFYVSNSSRDIRHIFCRSTNNGMCGFHNNGDATAKSGSNYTGFIDGVSYQECEATGNGRLGGSAFNFDGCRRVKVIDCRAADNLSGGISFFQGDGAGPCSGILLHRNDIELPASARRAVVQVVNGSGDLVIWGNRFKHNDPVRPELLVEGGAGVGLVSDYNRIDRFQVNDWDGGSIGRDEWMAKTGQDANSEPNSVPNSVLPPLPVLDYAAELADPITPKTLPRLIPSRVSVRLKNAGSATWAAGGDFKLGTQNPPDNATFGVNRFLLEGGPVPPGEIGTFSANLTANAGGTITLRPLIEGKKWLSGPTITIPIAVAADPVPPVVPPTIPPPAIGQGIVGKLSGQITIGGIVHDISFEVAPRKAT